MIFLVIKSLRGTKWNLHNINTIYVKLLLVFSSEIYNILYEYQNIISLIIIVSSNTDMRVFILSSKKILCRSDNGQTKLVTSKPLRQLRRRRGIIIVTGSRTKTFIQSQQMYTNKIMHKK